MMQSMYSRIIHYMATTPCSHLIGMLYVWVLMTQCMSECILSSENIDKFTLCLPCQTLANQPDLWQCSTSYTNTHTRTPSHACHMHVYAHILPVLARHLRSNRIVSLPETLLQGLTTLWQLWVMPRTCMFAVWAVYFVDKAHMVIVNRSQVCLYI